MSDTELLKEILATLKSIKDDTEWFRKREERKAAYMQQEADRLRDMMPRLP